MIAEKQTAKTKGLDSFTMANSCLFVFRVLPVLFDPLLPRNPEAQGVH